MKSSLASIMLLILILTSCGGDSSYYEQFTDDKAFDERILDLNSSIEKIRSSEKGKLIKDDINLLKYVYEIGENDTYIVSYLFDEKGCYEIGIDGYFTTEAEANNIVEGLKSTMSISKFETPTQDNQLSRWKMADGSITVDLDYKDTSRGLFLVTIFANE